METCHRCAQSPPGTHVVVLSDGLDVWQAGVCDACWLHLEERYRIWKARQAVRKRRRAAVRVYERVREEA